jgi:hypothetical protein
MTIGPQKDSTNTPQPRQNIGSSNSKPQTNGAAIKCYKCGEVGPKSSDCRKACSCEGKQLLMVDYQEEEEPQEYEPYSDEEDEEVVVKGDCGPWLVMRKVLLTS